MSKNLVIVESPAKAKTIAGYLGSDYVVKSSMGHVRDLPKSGMSIDIENNFEPSYQVNADKKKVIAELKKATKDAQTVWLASDEDREGEAIAWHLYEALNLKTKETKRIVFHEITKGAILKALETPRTIDQDLVSAQQARRVLDRIVGYELSPVLWKKVRPQLSAGRVQSVAVRLIVEKERELEAFEKSTSYKIKADFSAENGETLPAELVASEDTIDINAARTYLERSSGSTFKAASIDKKPGTRNPSAPFTTSSLQQTASNRLGFSPKSTMMLAQRLYEAGHITYMRTDSLNLSAQAIAGVKDYVIGAFGADYHQIRTFKTKSAGAQEAHEAIRPTNFQKLDAGADEQQKKLYRLIWQRTVASQMAPAKTEKTTILIDGQDVQYQAKGEMVTFDGFLAVESKRADDTLLPTIHQGDTLSLVSAVARETHARGPARYSEASLVRKLEELGIGRPSTYAPTISTVQDRGYVIKADVEGSETPITVLETAPGKPVAEKQETITVGADKNKLVPTDTGNVVTDFLVKHFSSIVDFDFTKDVEAKFDQVAEGKQDWHDMLREFYNSFHPLIESSADISRAEAVQSRHIGEDPKTGKPISARYGRFGPMVQIGVAEDEDKPRFASIPSNSSVEKITLEEALRLFDLPRTVGTTEAGEDIMANTGRFGPYLKVGTTNVSIPRALEATPFDITEAQARELITTHLEKKAAMNIKIFDGSDIKVLNGRYGPYITDGKKNAKIPKDTKPEDITLELATELIEKAPTKKRRAVVRKRKS